MTLASKISFFLYNKFLPKVLISHNFYTELNFKITISHDFEFPKIQKKAKNIFFRPSTTRTIRKAVKRRKSSTGKKQTASICIICKFLEN